jgi:hypothetical protein
LLGAGVHKRLVTLFPLLDWDNPLLGSDEHFVWAAAHVDKGGGLDVG